MNHPLAPLFQVAASGSRKPLRRHSQRLPLEQRFMFDGAVADAAHAAQAHDAAAAAVPPAVPVRAADPAKDEGKKEVALIDTSVANYKTLEAGIRAGVGIVEYDGSRDGLAQIAAWASTQNGLDAIHILSHGSEGVLNLGTNRLTTAALASADTQAQLAELGRALNADGDLLLYGCSVADGQGTALLDGLARAIGADVAASNDATGAARLGGDWTLETQRGQLDTRSLALDRYDSLLTIVDTSPGNFPEGSTVFTKTIGSVTLTFTLGPSSTVPGDTPGFWTDGPGVRPDTYLIGNQVDFTISVPAGYSFDLTAVSGLTEDQLVYHPTQADGSSKPDVTYTTGAPYTPETYSLTGLSGMSQLRITGVYYASFTSFNITLHALAPATTVNAASLQYDTGNSNSDFITNVAGQTISGTLSTALAAGERVQVSYDNGGHWSDATSYTVGSSSWSTTTTLSGSNTFQARVVNTGGYTSTAYSHTYTLDTTAPTTTLGNLALSPDSGASNTDFITNSASQTISATLSSPLAGGEIVQGSLDGGATWSNITSKVSGTTLSWNGVTLSGSGTLVVKISDTAGNDAPTASQTYTLDTTAPTTTIATLQFSNDSGTSNADFITNEAAQTVSGTLSANLQTGETVYVSLNNGSTWTAASASVGANTWSLGGVTLASSNTLRVKVTDVAGNDGTVRSQSYQYDTSAPTTTFSSLAFSNDTNIAGDFVTQTAAQTISATLSAGLSAGDVLYGSLDGGTTWNSLNAYVAGSALTWTGVSLGGSSSLQLKVTDAAGNDSAVRSQAYTLDTSAPAAPSTPLLASASDSGQSNSDRNTNDNTPTFTGTAEAGSTVTVYDGATLLGTTVATGGTWSYTATTLGSGAHTISATAMDLAGNVSTASSAVTVTIDTSAPAVNSVSVPANGTYYTGDAVEFTVNYDEAVYVDTSGGTPRIALTVGGATRYASYVSGSGSSALLFRYTVVNGDSDSDGIPLGALTANGGLLSDLAGNAGSTTLNGVGSTAAVLIDGSQASITNVSASNADSNYGAGQTITITVGFSGAVDVDTSGGTPTLTLNSGGTATYSGGSGTGTLTFSYTVGAGDNSADLDYASTAALALNGATISEAGGAHRNASLLLQAPGTAGSLGANKDIVVDTAAPSVTGATLVFSDDTGSSSSDRITNTAGQTAISGTLTGARGAGETVQVSLDNGLNWISATGSGSNWSIGARTLAASNTALVRVVDAAGNIGTAASFGYTLDTSAPATTFGTIRFSNDSGASNTDLNTNASAPTISATLSAAPAAGDQVFGSLDGGNSWTDITSKVSGTTLSWNGVTLAASNTLQFYVRDAAGNNGAVTSKAYVLDTVAPLTSVASVQLSSDTGISNSDFITKEAAQTISGTLSANAAAGETVYVSLDNGASWHAATTTTGLNTWSLAGVTLAASSTLLVKVSDTAGNDGPVLSQNYTYDPTPPAAASVTPLTTPSLTPVLSGGATLAAGETLTVSVGGATYNVVPVAGAWTLDLATAVPASGTLTLVLNTQYNVTATITDAAGNRSNDATSGELIVGTLIPPAVPPTTSAGAAALSQDSGASSTDFVTNVAAQTISGSLSAPLLADERVEVSLDGGTSWSSAAASGSSWSFSATLRGSGTLQVRVSGDGGSGPVYSRAYTLDTTPPGAPAADALSTSTLAPVLSGSAALADGDTLSVAVGGAEYAVSVVNGRWTLDLASATPASGALSLAAGASYSVVASVTDLAGNRSSSGATLSIAALPAVTSMALTADSGASNSDFVTNVAAQTVSGGLSAPLADGQTVQLSLDGGATWQNASVSGARWSASVTLSGSGTLVARVASAGATSATLQHAYVLDTSAPAATPTLVAQSADGAVSGALSAPLGAGETLLVSRDGGASWSALGASGQNWSLTLDGASSVLLQVRDSAGNAGGTLTVAASTTPQQPEQPEQPIPPVRPEPPALPPAPQQPPAAVPDTPLAGAAAAPQPVAPVVPPLAGLGNEVATTWPGRTPPPVVDTLPAYVALQPMAPIQSLPGDVFRIVTLPALPGGATLVAYTPIADIRSVSGERISAQISSDAFAHSSDSAGVTLSAQTVDGKALPGWLRFDGRTARFEGTPPPGFEGTLSFRVTARDSQGRVATQVFKIVVSKDGARTGHWQGEPAEPAGRASLNEQLRGARTAAAARLAALS